MLLQRKLTLRVWKLFSRPKRQWERKRFVLRVKTEKSDSDILFRQTDPTRVMQESRFPAIESSLICE